MNKKTRLAADVLITFAMAIAILTTSTIPVCACSPEFPIAVLVNTNHPDLPLGLFAAGNIGMVQPTSARSYLCVLYRYLTDMPLNSTEQASIVALWHKRLSDYDLGLCEVSPDNSLSLYLRLRSKITAPYTGKDSSKPSAYYLIGEYDYARCIGGDAVRVAGQTLAARIGHYGLKSKQVRDWLNAEDMVLGVRQYSQKDTAPRIPPPLPPGSDTLAAADRDYQRAAATLYTGDADKAAGMFAEIRKNNLSPWKTLAPYMVARCLTSASLGSKDDSKAKQAVTCIEELMAHTAGTRQREDLCDLLRLISYRNMDTTQKLNTLVSQVCRKNSPRLGGDIGDLTYLMDLQQSSTDSDDQLRNNKLPKPDQAKQSPDSNAGTSQDTAGDTRGNRFASVRQFDLTDWLSTMSDPDIDMWFGNSKEEIEKSRRDRQANDVRALSRWRATHSLPWLIAAVCRNGLRDPATGDLYAACLSIPKTSPAYPTVAFFINDAQIVGQRDLRQVASRTVEILSIKNLPPTTYNLFNAQLLRLSHNPEDYLRRAVCLAPELARNGQMLPDNYQIKESASTFTSEPTLDEPVAAGINRNLPLAMWVRWCSDKSVPAPLHNRLVRETWLRAQLLNQPQVADQLSAELIRICPRLIPMMNSYRQAVNAEQKRFALAYLILKNFGMSPYIQPVDRHGAAMNAFDYYNANYWVPLPMVQAPKKEDEWEEHSVVMPGAVKILNMMQDYYKPGLASLLTPTQKKQADFETALILKNHPSAFLGSTVFSWSSPHPDDPRLPEALYIVLKLPRWTGEPSKIGTIYSRKAYLLLHAKYPGTSWAKRATCYY